MDTSPFDAVAALIPAHPALTECLQYQVVGLVTVLATLAALWLICELVGMAFRATRIREESPQGGHDVPDDEPEQSAVHAAIIAAVHVALGPGHRVASVRLAHDASASAWCADGRREHLQSQAVR